jgi:hypothetical protein
VVIFSFWFGLLDIYRVDVLSFHLSPQIQEKKILVEVHPFVQHFGPSNFSVFFPFIQVLLAF